MEDRGHLDRVPDVLMCIKLKILKVYALCMILLITTDCDPYRLHLVDQ